jgi:DNA topoisomerase-6 subunit B
VAHYPEIIKEIKLALKECGRKLSVFLHQRQHQRNQEKRRSIFELYIGELVASVHKLTPVDRPRLQKQLLGLASKFTGQQEEAEEALEAGGVVPDRKVKGKAPRTGEAEADGNGNGAEAEEA